MTFSNTAILAVVELVVYLVLLPAAIYLAYCHRLAGLLGHIYLGLFCGVRLAADILQISNRNNSSPTLSSAVISSIGLSPLLLCLAGFIHESHHYLVTATFTHPQKMKKYMWLAQLQFHIIAVIGVFLLVKGSVDLYSSSSTLTPSEFNKDNSLRKAGVVVLLLVWLVLLAYAVWVYLHCRAASVRRNLKALALTTVIATPFVGVRAVYAVVYTSDSAADLNPITGTFAVKFTLIVLAQLFALLALFVGSWASRSIVKDHVESYEQVGGAGSDTELGWMNAAGASAQSSPGRFAQGIAQSRVRS